MLHKSKLKPEKIAELANQDLGSLVNLDQNSDCYLQQGYDEFSKTKHTYAICTNNAQFKNKFIKLEIRLVKEGSNQKINDFI